VGYSLREALAAFKRTPMLTGLSSAMVGLALFVVGLFSLAAHNLKLALETVEERVEIVAYLNDGVLGDEIVTAREELTSLPEVLTVNYVTKEEALEKARRDLPEFGSLFTDLDVNPLPASLEIQLRPGLQDPETLDRLATHAGTLPFVEQVQFGREWVDKLYMLRRMGGLTAMILGAGFAVVAALIIATAVRIAVFARKDEIKIMQLVGARDAFIRRPFLLEGAITGVLGGLLAAGLTFATFQAVFRYLFTISWIPTEWVLSGIFAGAVFGVISSSMAVSRHLREV
jgi:cell division transport system permease protein